jgi:hypothetical protein
MYSDIDQTIRTTILIRIKPRVEQKKAERDRGCCLPPPPRGNKFTRGDTEYMVDGSDACDRPILRTTHASHCDGQLWTAPLTTSTNSRAAVVFITRPSSCDKAAWTGISVVREMAEDYVLRVTVPSLAQAERLDKWLSDYSKQHLSDQALSRSQVTKLLEKNAITVNGKPIKKNYKV